MHRFLVIGIILASSVLMTAGNVGGCLLPAPIDEATDAENRPPRLVPVFPSPGDAPRRLDPDCPSYTFRASISDPDGGDSVCWRVFLDYHRTDNRPGSRNTPITCEEGTDELPAAIQFQVVPQDFPGADPLLENLNPHIVEMLVADRGFVSDASPEGRVIEDGGLTDSFVWTVVLDNSATCTAVIQ